MKKLSLMIAAALIVNNIHATIRTVSNNPSTIAQFNDLQAAIDASSSVVTDTVYVHGSPSGYGSITIANKRIVILGPGWAPNKNLPLKAIIDGCTITGAASSNTEIQGLDFTSNVTPNSAVTDLRFIRNLFESNVLINSGTYTGYIFEGNIFTLRLFGGGAYQNMLVQNNYFYALTDNVLGFSSCINVIFNHNLWFGPSAGSASCFQGCQSLIITNNIFVHRDAANNLSGSTFSNNITFNAGTNNPWAVNGNIDGGGNIANQDPQMVDQAAVNNGINDATLDFTIAAGPANNSGNDGKDMGLLYNVSPDPRPDLNWTISRNTRLPFVFSMNIVNPVIGAGGSLNVNVEARKNN